MKQESTFGCDPDIDTERGGTVDGEVIIVSSEGTEEFMT